MVCFFIFGRLVVWGIGRLVVWGIGRLVVWGIGRLVVWGIGLSFICSKPYSLYLSPLNLND